MIYDYKCNHCLETFEVWATLAEKEKGLQPKCPKCSSEDTRQVIGAVALGVTSKGSSDINLPPTCGPAAGPGCC